MTSATIAASPSPSSHRPESSRAVRSGDSAREAAYDAGLVRRFNDGDEAAFVEIVARHRGRLLSVALSHLRNHADAEEIAQDTLIRAHRALARFRGDSSLATWLHHIAANLSRNRYKYFFCRRRHASVSLDSAISEGQPGTFADLVACDDPAPDRRAATDEFSELIGQCLEGLGAQHREILALRNGQRCSYGEIARTLGITVGTVKSRIARARESLRLLLVETYPEYSADAPPASWFEPARASGYLAVA
jgi:RNA polymerase sigma-70 factor (ECF subfamily)